MSTPNFYTQKNFSLYIQAFEPISLEDVQTEIIAQYFLVEGMKEALQANDYTILENITPDLQKIIDKHNEV